MPQQNLSILSGIILLAVVAVVISFSTVEYIFPPEANGNLDRNAPWWAWLVPWQGDQQRSIRTHYGLDLVGGSQVVLEADLGEIEVDEGVDEDALSGLMSAARVVIENRVSGGLGVVEPRVQLGGSNRIIVELPEVDNPDQAISLIRETGRLEFVEVLNLEVADGARLLTSLAASTTVALTQTESITDFYTYGSRIFPTVMTGAELEDAAVDIDQSTGGRIIAFTLTDAGQAIFSQYTLDHIGDFLAITLDGVVVSAPRIQDHIPGRSGIISSGNPTGFSANEAEDIAIKLKYGALPVPLKVVENRTVGPTLGRLSVERSLRAGLVGLVIVLLFMLVHYRLPGFFATLALILYALLNYTSYKLLPVTLTVPAITGFILSIGMAVDANILVFERMREELRSGRSFRRATEAAFVRSWPSIRDSNLSTLITCAILFWFGSNFGASIVRGFAVTLAIGVVINLFTAITVTRALLRFAVAVFGTSMQNNARLLLGFDLKGDDAVKLPGWAQNAFQIVQKRPWFYTFSACILMPCLIAMGLSITQFGSPMKLAIDYTGGTLWEIKFLESQVSPDEIRDLFEGEGFTGTSVQLVNEDETVIIRAKEINIDDKQVVSEKITTQLGVFDEFRFESVGPSIGEEVTQASGIAVSVASIAILLFIWYVFRTIPNAFRYGVGAIVAMLHDILVTAGLFAILGLVLGWEVDALFLSAILTVIGYSVNDTIVVFDRIRENIPIYRNEHYEMVVNRSLLETVQRSLATSFSTLFVIGAILIFGGGTTQQFTAVMFIGIISGTYSSIFTAVPFVVSWSQGEFGGRARGTQQAEAVGG